MFLPVEERGEVLARIRARLAGELEYARLPSDALQSTRIGRMDLCMPAPIYPIPHIWVTRISAARGTLIFTP